MSTHPGEMEWKSGAAVRLIRPDGRLRGCDWRSVSEESWQA